jgi:hypothetical protein
MVYNTGKIKSLKKYISKTGSVSFLKPNMKEKITQSDVKIKATVKLWKWPRGL